MASRRADRRQRVLAQHVVAGTRTHHNGAPVDMPDAPAPTSRPSRDAGAAAAHNLTLAPHASTPLMEQPFDWAEHGAPRRDGLRVVSPAMAEQFDRDG